MITAGQAASRRSSRQPGSASQPTAANAARCAGAGGTTWQAPSNKVKAAIPRAIERSERTMIWIYVEALVALLIFVGIVAWTMAARRKPDADNARDDEGK